MFRSYFVWWLPIANEFLFSPPSFSLWGKDSKISRHCSAVQRWKGPWCVQGVLICCPDSFNIKEFPCGSCVQLTIRWFEITKKSRYCWKFRFWNLNGYSDLSAVEGIVGKGGWGMGKRRNTWSSSRCEQQGVTIIEVTLSSHICDSLKLK